MDKFIKVWDQPCTTKLRHGKLKTTLEITQFPKLKCCKSFRAEFSLQLDGETEESGLGDAFPGIIDKTAKGDPARPKGWIRGFLRNPYTRGVEWPTQPLRCLYNRRGSPWSGQKRFDSELKSEKIIYIEEFLINEPYRHIGLGRAAFSGLHAVLGTPAQGAGLQGSMMLLQLNRIDDDERGERSYAQMRQGLIAWYQKQGYRVCFADNRPEDYTYPLMCKEL